VSDFNTINDVPMGCGCAACRDSLSSPQNLGEPGQGSDTFINNGPDKLLSGSVWANDQNGLTLDYNFWSSLPSYYTGSDDEANGFTSFSVSMEAATVRILDQIETFTNITFVETTSEANTELGFAQASLPDGIGGWAYYPHPSARGGDVWMNTKYVDDTNIDEGEYGFFALMHEVGHALGLQHTFDGGLTGDQNTEQYSVMAYDFSPWGGTTYAETFQLYDIWALQELYGANTSYNSGDTNYALRSGDAYTIWDGGGEDTLDGSGNSGDQVISLEEGTFSSVGLTDNISIAYNVLIENARGGSGNDVIAGNDSDNLIWGNAGDDTIYASAGSDIIDGGFGQDTMIYDLAYTDYEFSDSGDGIFVRLTDAIIDTVRNVEEFIFNGVNFTLEELAEFFEVVVNDYVPDVTVSDLSLTAGEVVLASSVMGATDADDNPLTYAVWDGGRPNTTSYFQLDGVRLASGQAVSLTQAEFDRLEIVGGDKADGERMWLRASDGENVTGWHAFNVTSAGEADVASNNYAPVVTVADVSVAVAGRALVSDVMGATDADGDVLTYAVWDGGKPNNTSYFMLDNVRLDAGETVTMTQAEFDRLEIVGGSNIETERMWLRASDGEHTTGWNMFEVTSVAGGGTNNFAPLVVSEDFEIGDGDFILANTVITASDADGNDLLYTVWDSVGGHYFRLDGVELAAKKANVLTQDEFDRLEIVGNGTGTQESMWVRVSDGDHLSEWSKFHASYDGEPAGIEPPAALDANDILDFSDGENDILQNLLASSESDSGVESNQETSNNLSQIIDTNNDLDQVFLNESII
jgi:hypothetical protein